MTAELLTADDVAEVLNISAELVRRRTNAEGWPCVRFSRKTIRYRPEHLEAIIGLHEVEADQPTRPGMPTLTARSRARWSS